MYVYDNTTGDVQYSRYSLAWSELQKSVLAVLVLFHEPTYRQYVIHQVYTCCVLRTILLTKHPKLLYDGHSY